MNHPYINSCAAVYAVLVIAFTVGSISNASAQDLEVFFKINTPDSDFRQASISLIKHKGTAQTFSPPKRKVRLNLAYDSEYTLLFEMEGCRTKEFRINTKKVPRHMKEEGLEVAFVIELSKTFQFNPDPYMNTSVVKWYYHADNGQFAYLIDSFPDSSLEANDNSSSSHLLNRNMTYERITSD